MEVPTATVYLGVVLNNRIATKNTQKHRAQSLQDDTKGLHEPANRVWIVWPAARKRFGRANVERIMAVKGERRNVG